MNPPSILAVLCFVLLIPHQSRRALHKAVNQHLKATHKQIGEALLELNHHGFIVCPGINLALIPPDWYHAFMQTTHLPPLQQATAIQRYLSLKTFW